MHTQNVDNSPYGLDIHIPIPPQAALVRIRYCVCCAFATPGVGNGLINSLEPPKRLENLSGFSESKGDHVMLSRPNLATPRRRRDLSGIKFFFGCRPMGQCTYIHTYQYGVHTRYIVHSVGDSGSGIRLGYVAGLRTGVGFQT